MPHHPIANDKESTMRKFALLIAATVMIVAGFAPISASADPPVVFEESFTFSGVNPCTGEPHDISIDLEVRLHPDHQNNLVVNLSRSGTTSDGAIMLSGTESFNENAIGLRAHLNDVWHNPETGDRFQALGLLVVKFDPHEHKVDKFRLRCLGN